MKKMTLIFSIIILAQSAFSMTERELTSKVTSDVKFIQSVEAHIKSILGQPGTVKLWFRSAGAKMYRTPYFSVDFDYAVKYGSAERRFCSFTAIGAVQADSSLMFKKIAHTDCGE